MSDSLSHTQMNGEQTTEFHNHSIEACPNICWGFYVCVISKCWKGAFFHDVGFWIGDFHDIASLIPLSDLSYPYQFLIGVAIIHSVVLCPVPAFGEGSIVTGVGRKSSSSGPCCRKNQCQLYCSRNKVFYNQEIMYMGSPYSTSPGQLHGLILGGPLLQPSLLTNSVVAGSSQLYAFLLV